MNILQVNSVCGISSTGRIAESIGHLLTEKGHESFIAYGRGVYCGRESSKRIGSDVQVAVHAFMSRLTDRQGLYSNRATKELISLINTRKPDIIHLHNIHGYYLNYYILFSYLQKANIPIVWTLHDCWPFTGHCAFFDYIGCEKWKTQCCNCPQKKEYPSSYVLDYSHENYLLKKESFSSVKNMVIVTPSEWMAGLVRESFLSDKKTAVINNGIDTTIFSRKEKNDDDVLKKYNIDSLSSKNIILGVANTWSKRKGLLDFIELANRLPDEYKIVLVGIPKDQIDNLHANIIGLPRTDSADDLAALYRTASVFANPTYDDNYPTTNIEALACGTPVVTYDIGGSAEPIPNKKGVVAKGDVDGLLAAITGELYSVDVQEGQFEASQKYKQYISLYESILHECK